MGFWLVGFRPACAASAELLSAVRFSTPGLLHAGSFIVIASADRILIEHSLGPAEVGRYQPAYLFATAGFSLIQGLNYAWAPAVHRTPEPDRWAFLAESSPVLYAISATVAGCGALLSPVGLAILVPASYNPGALVPVSALVLLSIIPMVAYLSGTAVLFDKRQSLAVVLCTCGGAVLNVALNLVLIRRYELIGAAAATLVAYLAWSAAVLTIAVRAQSVPWRPAVRSDGPCPDWRPRCSQPSYP